MSLTDPRTLQAMTDEALIARVARLAAAARESTADLIAHLVELEGRNLHLALGFRSLFGYCQEVLHFSEAESYSRMEAAQAARRFPVLLPLLAEGLLHMTAVRLLAPHLADENHLALLGGAFHKSRREVEELLARWFPKEDVSPVVRKLPQRASPHPASAASAPESVAGSRPETRPECVPEPPVTTPVGPAARSVVPLAPARYKVEFTAREATIAKLRLAQELLSHSVPDGDVGEIFDRALDLVIAEAQRTRHAQTERSMPSRPSGKASRAIPAAVEREVWARDGGRCGYVGLTGKRCDERRFIQFHHVKPWAASGPPTAENIALRCRAHNQYEADRYFGPIRAARETREM